MKKEELFREIGNIDEALICAAELPLQRRKKGGRIFLMAAVLFLLSASVWASNYLMVQRYGTINRSVQYHTIPSAEKIKKEFGFATNLVETFSNGYTFQTAFLSHNRDFDEENRVIESYRGLRCVYGLGDQTIDLSVDNATQGEIPETTLPIAIYHGIGLRYEAYVNKFVPGDYQMTEQDRKDKASGTYVFGFGSDQVRLAQVQILSWTDQGVNYVICAIDSPLTKSALVRMAEELIDQQKRSET